MFHLYSIPTQLVYILTSCFFITCRELITSYNILQDDINDSYVGCGLVLIEHFPAAIYVDPYQLARNENLDGVKVGILQF